jgi:hypothetical protein
MRNRMLIGTLLRNRVKLYYLPAVQTVAGYCGTHQVFALNTGAATYDLAVWAIVRQWRPDELRLGNAARYIVTRGNGIKAAA